MPIATGITGTRQSASTTASPAPIASRSHGRLPWDLLAIGAGLAVVLALCRVPVMPVAIGIYLSIQLSFTIFLGGGLRLLADKYRRSASEPCTLLSAGMIAGEGLAGILIALLTVFA